MYISDIHSKRKNSKNRFDERKDKMTGHCRFCGQAMITDGTTEEEANYEASMNCRCEAAKAWSRQQDTIENAKANAKGLFPEVSEELMGLMFSCINVIGGQHTNSVNIKINDRVKCSIFRKNESIIVRRSYKEENTLGA